MTAKHQSLAIALILLAATILTTPQATGGDVGGTILNQPPIASDLQDQHAQVENPDETDETFTWRVHDANGVKDIQAVWIEGDHPAGPDAMWTLHDGQAGKACNSPNPDSTRWTCTGDGPGTLVISYRHTWSAGADPGTASIQACARDADAQHCTTTATTKIVTASRVDPGALLEVYDQNGDQVPENWGNWQASPGDTNVESQNYLRARNTGSKAGAITVAFQDDAFTLAGGTDEVPIRDATTDNLQFCHASAATAQAKAPRDHDDWDCSPAFQGAASFQVDAGTTTWIAYSINKLPDIVKDGQYTATYTAS